MSCNNKLHGALYRNYLHDWYCLACGELVNLTKLDNLRDLVRAQTKRNDEEKNEKQFEHDSAEQLLVN